MRSDSFHPHGKTSKLSVTFVSFNSAVFSEIYSNRLSTSHKCPDSNILALILISSASSSGGRRFFECLDIYPARSWAIQLEEGVLSLYAVGRCVDIRCDGIQKLI